MRDVDLERLIMVVLKCQYCIMYHATFHFEAHHSSSESDSHEAPLSTAVTPGISDVPSTTEPAIPSSAS